MNTPLDRVEEIHQRATQLVPELEYAVSLFRSGKDGTAELEGALSMLEDAVNELGAAVEYAREIGAGSAAPKSRRRRRG